MDNASGILNTENMFDSLIVDCDGLVKLLFDGQRVAFCLKVVEMVQKLSALKDGVISEIGEKDEQIRGLKAKLNGGDPDAAA